ncbi:MAG: NYN domain-containing protein [Clostridia bacterium]|nr:NYN domain-containing protein [Clostridia bacterium]
MKRTVIGILAHVDAGKTTLSEAMLYGSGGIRTLGRVDHGDAFLDTFALERQRGITIFSKQAVLSLPDWQATLLDTPGHVDFSAEMERTLDVLDCAILVVSGPAGVQSHTHTVWNLLRRHNIPTFLFINKMDLPGADRETAMAELHRALGDGFVNMTDFDPEAAAMCDEALLDEFLETGNVRRESLSASIHRGKVFPCWFGAALKLEGIEPFLRGLQEFAPTSPAMEELAAKVYKISRDEQGVRLTHMKVTGGTLRVRDTLKGADWEEKITQLRVYSGAKYKAVEEALPGDIVAAVGLTRTAPGLGLGAEKQGHTPALEPVLTYRVILPVGYDAMKALQQFRQLEEEEPQLHVDWNARLRELRVQLMGPVQLEILHQLLLDRFNLEVEFDQGSILYRETIAAPVEGVGHYEPLRHYAEVHLLLEPAERGSGLRIATACREDDLDRNWQRLILTHLLEKQHLGVLTGSPITDITITLLSGRAHLKHTEGGDFRQATYRAVRQGLMQAKSVLLEPWYEFRLEVPQANVGRAMTDLQRLGAEFDPPETAGDFAVLNGTAPVAALRDYPQEVTAYTRGLGRFACTLKGYAPCKNQAELAGAIGYYAEADIENTADSVFCSHGAGYTVYWADVPKHMHLPFAWEPEADVPEEEDAVEPQQEMAARHLARMASDEELMAIYERTYGPIRKDPRIAMQPVKTTRPQEPVYRGNPLPTGPEYLLVDGYNIIFAWDDLKKLAEDNLNTARSRLIDMLRNYQGYKQSPVIVVFDAYKVKGNPGTIERYGDFAVVYTKEAETADMYIEKVTYELGKKHRVRVATSDGLEQIIILGHGAWRVSASAFREELKEVEKSIREFLSE